MSERLTPDERAELLSLRARCKQLESGLAYRRKRAVEWAELAGKCEARCKQLEADKALLDYYDKNPHCVVFGQGYRSTSGRWLWRDKDANFHDAPSLREAIAAVLIRDPVETHEP